MVVMTTSGRDPSRPHCQGNTQQITQVLSAGSFSILRRPEVKFPWVEGLACFCGCCNFAYDLHVLVGRLQFFFWHFQVKILLHLQAGQILISFFSSYFSNHSY